MELVPEGEGYPLYVVPKSMAATWRRGPTAAAMTGIADCAMLDPL